MVVIYLVVPGEHKGGWVEKLNELRLRSRDHKRKRTASAPSGCRIGAARCPPTPPGERTLVLAMGARSFERSFKRDAALAPPFSPLGRHDQM